MASSKTYLRYEERGSFGVVAAHESNVCVDASGTLAVASGVQDVLLWNVRSGELEHRFRPPVAQFATERQLTALRLSPQDKFLAAGYASGALRVWDYAQRAFQVTLTGHRAAVSCVRFSADNARMVSGSRDTDVIVWDLVAQTGLFRLKGHKQEVTDAWFLGGTQLLTSSRDTLIKLWDLETQHCLHTFVGHRSPVWALAVNPAGDRVVTASSDNLLRGLALVPPEERTAQTEGADSTASLVQAGEGKAARELGAPWRLMDGAVSRQTAERAVGACFSRSGRFLACQTAGRTLEVYRVRTPEEVEHKIKRRVKRAREKARKKGADAAEPEAEQLETVQLGDELQLVAALRTDHRMRSFDFGRVSANKVDLVVSFNSNCMEVYTLNIEEEAEEAEAEETGAGDDEAKSGSKKAKKKAKRKRDVQMKRSRAIELQGHRNDVRGVAISSDDTLVLTAASGAAKLWNVKSKSCIRTFQSGYSLCCAFVPGDMHALVGTKSGHLLLYNLSSGAVISEIAAHDDAIWSIDVRPDGKGFVTGSADKQVKFWEFELSRPADAEDGSDSEDGGNESDASSSSSSSSSSSGSAASSQAEEEKKSGSSDDNDNEDGDSEPAEKRTRQLKEEQDKPSGGAQAVVNDLEVVHVRTLKMSEDVMCVKYSHHKSSARLILAVALLDCTVKVFYEDSLKFCLSLYGHKLPVLSMDISDDNTLIATASADKNVKLWGLDFGDCHKSFFAHDASVMSVRFVPRTHYFFTAGKDNRVRYWDADKFEMILNMEGHVGEVWCLAVASDGAFLVSSGHDKALRIWERTQDIVFPDEERERELEAKFDEKLLSDADPSKVGTQAVEAVRQGAVPGVAIESAAANKRTGETVKQGERLSEALDVADEYRAKLKQYEEDLAYAMGQLSEEARAKQLKSGKPLIAPPPLHVLMMGRQPTAYILQTLRRIKNNELEEAIMLLPFAHAVRLFHYLESAFEQACSSAPGEREATRQDVELATKVTTTLVRVHFKQLVATHTLKETLKRVRRKMRQSLDQLQDLIGTNMAALRMLKGQVLFTSV